jgi:hypothetical protein
MDNEVSYEKLIEALEGWNVRWRQIFKERNSDAGSLRILENATKRGEYQGKQGCKDQQGGIEGLEGGFDRVYLQGSSIKNGPSSSAASPLISNNGSGQQQDRSLGSEGRRSGAFSTRDMSFLSLPPPALPDDEHQFDTAGTANSVANDEISLLELPPPVYESTTYDDSSLESESSVPSYLLDGEGSSDLTRSVVLRRTPSASFLSADWSDSMMPERRNYEVDTRDDQTPSPSASLLLEESRLLEEDSQDSGHERRWLRSPSPALTPYPSLESSAASLEYGLSQTMDSMDLMPTIYPGMEDCPPVEDGSGPDTEDWSNRSRSLFNSTPPHHHRVVAIPVNL